MLTTSELKQVKHYLAVTGMKDTQFVNATVPLSGHEQLAIVQDGVNKIAPFSEILESIGAPLKKDVCTYSWYMSHQDELDTSTIYVCTTADGTQVIQIYLQGYPFISTADAEFAFSANRSAAFIGEDNSTTLNATVSPIASDITFYDGDTVLRTTTDSTSLSHTLNVTGSKTFTAKAHILGREMTKNLTITGVKHIYWGAGNSPATSNAASTDTTPRNVTFTMKINNLGLADSTHYLYFEVPAGWQVYKLELVDNENFPMEMTIHSTPITAHNTGYTAYRNEELRAAGTHNYRIYVKSL